MRVSDDYAAVRSVTGRWLNIGGLLVTLTQRDDFNRLIKGGKLRQHEMESLIELGIVDANGQPHPEFLKAFNEACPSVKP